MNDKEIGLDDRNELADLPLTISRKPTTVESEKARLDQQDEESRYDKKQADFGTIGEAVDYTKTQNLPIKVIPLDQKLPAPNYDTVSRLKKIQEKLSIEGLNKRLYEDIDDFKDLREERALRNSLTYGEAKLKRKNFVKSVTIKKPNIVSEFMKVFSMETKQISDLINEDKKAFEDLVPVKNQSSSSSKTIKNFTDTLVSQSALMQKLLSKKSKAKEKNMFRDQIAKKFDKLFNYGSATNKESKIKQYKHRHGPKLYMNKPHVVQAK